MNVFSLLCLLNAQCDNVRDELACNSIFQLGAEGTLLFELVQHVLFQLFAVLAGEELALDFLLKSFLDLLSF